MLPWAAGMQYMIVAFPGHTHLLLDQNKMCLFMCLLTSFSAFFHIIKSVILARCSGQASRQWFIII